MGMLKLMDATSISESAPIGMVLELYVISFSSM